MLNATTSVVWAQLLTHTTLVDALMKGTWKPTKVAGGVADRDHSLGLSAAKNHTLASNIPSDDRRCCLKYGILHSCETGCFKPYPSRVTPSSLAGELRIQNHKEKHRFD